MPELEVVIRFKPVVFGMKEKLMCMIHFRDNATIRNALKNGIKTDNEKLGDVQGMFKLKMEIDLFNELNKLKEKKEVEDYQMLVPDNPKEIRFKMIGNEEMVSKWEKDWKNKTGITDVRGFALRTIGVYVETIKTL